MSNDQYKLCPYCGEEIKVIAVKCKHCKSDLTEDGLSSTSQLVEMEPEEIPVVTVEYKCPKCSAFIQEGVTYCGNCRAQIAWKGGRPGLSAGYVMQQTGCAITSIGCMLPLLIIIIAFVIMLFSI